MAIKFAVRGNSMDARYSSSGKTPGQLRGTGSGAGSGTTVVNSAAAGMIGSSYIDQYQATNDRHGLIYPGGNSLWTGQPFSILIRCAKKVNAVDMCLFSIAGVSGETHGVIKCFLGNASKNVMLAINNDYNQTVLAQTDTGTGLTLNTFHDVVLTWTGTTAANGIKLYIDGVLINQYTATTAALATHEIWLCTINVGYVQGINTTRIFTEEFVIWDSVIDPTSVLLTSGLGSLNGASRTAFVDVAAFDGTYDLDPGAANVTSGTSYVIDGVTMTGSYAVPNYTDPGIANVRLSTSYVFNNSTLVGTLSVPSSDSASVGAVNISNIKENIRYVLNEANTITGTPIDLSGNLTTRVNSILKVNPESIKLDANIFPYVTVFLSKKDIANKSIAGSQAIGKKEGKFTFTIVGCLWNDLTTDYKVDSADEDIEKLMENVEVVLRHHTSLNGNVNWQFPTGVTYHTSPVGEQSHVRVGVMELQATVWY